MPLLQKMAERANRVFNREHIGSITIESFDGKSFATLAGELGIAPEASEQQYLKSWPPSIQEAIKAAVKSALQRSPRIPVTVSWAPGYDFELMISESRNIGDSVGGITIFLRSRYPGE